MGRRLVEGVKKVRIMGEEISVRAHIYNLDGLSAHADRDEIVEWLKCFVNKPANVFLVHGEVESAEALSALITAKLAFPSYIPRYGDTAVFQGRTWKIEASTITLPPEPALKELQGYINELDTGLAEYKQKLERLAETDPSKMPAVLERLEKLRQFVRSKLGELSDNGL